MGQQGRFFRFPAILILASGCTGTLVASSSDQPGQQEACDDPATCVSATTIASRRDQRANPRAQRPWQDAGTPIIDDAGEPPIADAGQIVEPTPEPDAGEAPIADSGVTSPEPDAGTPPPPTTACVDARRLWFEDFETGDYSRWSGGGYGAGWGDGCQDNGLSTVRARSGTTSNRSEITCRSHTDVHRGYGGVQFSGDSPLSSYTNSGVGTDAPHGVVNTFWVWLDVPYDFGSGRWLSLWTTNSDCGWGERVLTLGLENAGRRLTPAHVTSTGGTVTFSPGAPSLPLRQWVRVTVYVNYHAGEMHVWQDGASVVHANFSRPTNDICQWHWGAYASGDNTDIELFEDDKSIWKLEEAWTDWSSEPWFEGGVTPCP